MIYIDTGALIAKYCIHDQFHRKAVKLWGTLEKNHNKLVTSSFVIDETVTLLARKTYYEFAAEKAYLIYHSGCFEILRPTLETELCALKYFEKFSDQKVSFTDCVSFQLMKENNIRKAFTFDKHYNLAGFKII